MSTRRNTAGPELHAVSPAAASLLERPLTARSVVLSLLLGRHPPSARVALLVRWCALFGVSGTAARVALSRMVDRGELTAHEGTYELTERLRGRQASQEFALAPSTTQWDGGWRVEIVVGTDRSPADRAALRDAMARLRLGELREGVWCRPDNLPDGAAPPDAVSTVAAQCAAWRGAVPDAPAGDVVARLFDPAGWATRGAVLLDRLMEVTAAMDGGSLTDAFVTGAATAQHLRRDPLLPDPLLPAGWPGDDLRVAYARYVERFGAAVAAWTAVID